MRKISLYTTSGEIAGTTYYRIYQYLDNGKYIIRKCPRLTNRMYSKWMPISAKNIIFQLFAFVIFYFRNLFHLGIDCFYNPDIIVLSRSFLNRILPISYKVMINFMRRRGTKFVWDFDDDIISSREFTKGDFDWFSEIASNIIVASKNNIEMIKSIFHSKCIILPTTDRDMYRSFSEDLITKRTLDLNNTIRLIWVGTAVSLPYVKTILPYIEDFAIQKKSNGINVIFTIVCNKSLNYHSKYLQIRNVKWTRKIACEEMKLSHIGLMPLQNTESNRRKGGFKLIQYLSIGLPIIGSPVGINDRIIIDEVGIKAKIESKQDWINGLNTIINSSENYKKFNIAAYNHWKTNYSYDYNLMKWDSIIEKVSK